MRLSELKTDNKTKSNTPSYEEQMEIVKQIMKRRRVLLQALADYDENGELELAR